MKRLALAPVRQHFQRPRVEDVEAEVRFQMQRLEDSVRPGMSVAISAGSRGINGIADILRTIVRVLRSLGAEPFIFASMGSHGGGTSTGQKNLLHHLGLTEEAVEAPFRITSESLQIATTESGHILFADAEAAKADTILVVNRIKPHTAFRDRLASGLFKMLTVGMGKVPGASQVHRLGSMGIYPAIVELGRLALARLPVIGGLAIVENSFDETAKIEVLLPSEIETGEKRLLEYAWKLLPGLPLNDLDLLIIDEIGKNYSGTGMDTNVVGRWRDIEIPGPIHPQIGRIVVLRLSKASEGNANGLGLADFTTKKLVEAIDWKATLTNVRTTGFWGRAFCPPFPGSDYDAIQWALESLKVGPDYPITVARIANTLHLEKLWLNQAVWSLASGCERIGPFTPLSFDRQGDITLGCVEG
ncbi:MAG: DUF2088 domain-containing protein [Syntrophales bacterium LBB04]|nr:DUF2088 domain-containing protein [Syntrophales bacterium LBB04]